MTTEVILPGGGMGIEEATVVSWLKAEGDHVTEGEVIAEVETAKATQEIEAPVSGRISAILLPIGETAEINTVICLIEDDDG